MCERVPDARFPSILCKCTFNLVRGGADAEEEARGEVGPGDRLGRHGDDGDGQQEDESAAADEPDLVITC